MTTKHADSQTIDVPTLGTCTLLPLSSLPENMRTYEHIAITAQALGLGEIKKPSHQQIQEMAKALANHFRQSCSIWISGVVHAYPKIFLDSTYQPAEKCVMSIELFMDQKSLMDICIDHIPIESSRRIHRGEMVVCIFKGEPTT